MFKAVVCSFGDFAASIMHFAKINIIHGGSIMKGLGFFSRL